MKRILSLIFVASIALAVGACSDNEAPDARVSTGGGTPDAAVPATPDAATPKPDAM